MVQRVEQGRGLQQAAAALGVELDGVGAGRERGLVAPDEQLRADISGHAVAELKHLAELVTGVDVQQRERESGPGKKAFCASRSMTEESLPMRVEHDGPLELGRDFAQDVNALRFKKLEVSQRVQTGIGVLPGERQVGRAAARILQKELWKGERMRGGATRAMR